MTTGRPTQKVEPSPPRVVITQVQPEIEGGRFPIKRVQGERVAVSADIFADGHDLVSAVLRHRRAGKRAWVESPLRDQGNDVWRGEFIVTEVGDYEYDLEAWVDRFKSWRRGFGQKVEAGQDVSQEQLIGAILVEEASQRAAQKREAADEKRLREWAEELRLFSSQGETENPAASQTSLASQLARSAELAALMDRYPDKRFAATYGRILRVVVDRLKARFSTWYEMFPRSSAPEPGQHGTFKDCEAHLPYIAAMGFDVLYLPPIHPIGRTNRRGKNNSPVAQPDDVGSPWAIGAEEGGHKSVHPQLGTLADFDSLSEKARHYGLEVALDLAYQCSPDHPAVKAHPQWFRHRPDGSVQYAENPPKKYEDIYPFNFESDHWRSLWEELLSIARFWIERGVRIFRVDNPHTKPFVFWEWLIREIKGQHPEVIFLAEAFTRPKVMQRLAQVGFTQSYTYFTWRNTKSELTGYFTELNQTPMREYFRPNLWPNTPDILAGYLQSGGRPAFIARLVLAATLAGNYGIYGPAFELCENTPLAPGKEEYLDAEKYQLRHWDIARADSLRDLIVRINRARSENPALASDARPRFHKLDNDQLVVYSKAAEDLSNVVLVVVNLDFRYTQSGWVELALEELGLNPQVPYQVHDLLTDARYLWSGPRNYVQLDPHAIPAHIFRIA